jgi:phage terminase large subunit GpA-like protein
MTHVETREIGPLPPTAAPELLFLGASPIEIVRRRALAGFAPPPRLRVSEFSDREIVNTTGPLAGSKWQTSFAPYQRGILDVFHEPGVETAVVMGSSQWGKTACAVNMVAYHIKHDPCPILVVEPTVKPMAEDFSKNRLEPVIKASPALAEVVGHKRQKDASNTTLQKTFKGGSIAIGGANSAASLAARPTRFLVLDEIDRYPHQLPGEGNTIAIARKRTGAFKRRRRILMLSSPTLVGAPIDTWFHRGDQRRYFVPCPSCAHLHTYEWANVRWQDNDPATAYLKCPACEHHINEAERIAVLARGEWRPTNPDRRDRRIVSFHIWEAYSPLSSLADIVAGFLDAHAKQEAGDPSEMHTWENTTLGEPVEQDKGEGVESHVLLLRKESYPDAFDVPAGVCLITAGIDTQDDRLEALVIGWGPGEEAWLVDRRRFDGDTSQPEPWKELDQLLEKSYRHPVGVQLPIAASFIDSAGHRTDEVYEYAAKKATLRCHASIGRAGERPIVKFTPSARRYGNTEREVALWTLGVDSAKALWYARFKVGEPGPGYVHIPHSTWADEGLALQLTSEKLVRKFQRGFPITFWKKIRHNEMLDCAVMALAAMRLLDQKLDVLAARLGIPPKPKPPKPARTPWVPKREWFRGRR